MSIRRLLFQCASIIKFKLSMLVKYKADLITIISLKINLFSPWYSWKIVELALNNNHSLTHWKNVQPFVKRWPGHRNGIYLNIYLTFCLTSAVLFLKGLVNSCPFALKDLNFSSIFLWKKCNLCFTLWIDLISLVDRKKKILLHIWILGFNRKHYITENDIR